MKDHHTQNHTPVLKHEVLHYLAPKPGENYLDLTAGYGGHAHAILARTLQTKNSVLVDRDSNAISVLKHKFHDARIVHSNFASAVAKLNREGRQFDMILADLGVSSPQLDKAERGFSFAKNGPLDMRMDSTQSLTAAGLIDDIDEATLIDILRIYGEEPHAKKIARMILANRPFVDTMSLADCVEKAVGGRWGRIHPATRTFQALRIAVNDELSLLEATLPQLINLMAVNGRIAIITFHSLEDRIVKNWLTEYGGNRYDTELTILTRKPVTSTKNELVLNPRARSAKLRAAAKIKTKGNDNAYTGKK